MLQNINGQNIVPNTCPAYFLNPASPSALLAKRQLNSTSTALCPPKQLLWEYVPAASQHSQSKFLHDAHYRTALAGQAWHQSAAILPERGCLGGLAGAAAGLPPPLPYYYEGTLSKPLLHCATFIPWVPYVADLSLGLLALTYSNPMMATVYLLYCA